MSTSSSNINIVSMLRGTLTGMVTLQFNVTYFKAALESIVTMTLQCEQHGASFPVTYSESSFTRTVNVNVFCTV